MRGRKLLFVVVIFTVLLATLACDTSYITTRLRAGFIHRLYVTPGAGASEACSNWKNACSLQAALQTAAEGNEIWVQAGIYTPTTSTLYPESTFQLVSGVKLYGGFAGTETKLDQRDWEKNLTILSGDIAGDDITDDHGVVVDAANIRGQNSFNVVTGSGVDATAVIDGFIITAGYSPLYGGGMTNWSGSPAVSNVIFSGNRAGDVGGGMFNYVGGNGALTNVKFIGNSADHNGGGLYNHESSPVLIDVTFSDNKAGNGAAMVNYINSSPTLTNVNFTANVAKNKSGGMDNSEGSNPVLNQVVFENNRAMYGGGMYSYKSNPVLTDVTFTGNVAGNVGGGMENEESNPTLTDVTFIQNRAVNEGGGMFNWARSSVEMTNVTFNANSSGGGGGMKSYDSTLTLTNVTFYGNSARAGGGGMANANCRITLLNVTFFSNSSSGGGGVYSASGSSTLTNVILWGNTPIDSQLLREGGFFNVSYSDIQGGYNGTGNLNVNPQLKKLADNGGLTQTNALNTGSRVIDAGSPDLCPEKDQRGQSRPVDGDGDGKQFCDMGAYEYSGE